MQPMKKPLEIETGAKPDTSIIWLHGLGADGYDFAPIAEALELPVPVRFVFPHAPVMPVTINGGYQMPAWYDIVSPEITHAQDEAGIRNAQAMLDGLIAQEATRGIPSARILLAGFSQGGAIALQAGLRHPEKLGGILALSTYLPLHQTVAAERSPANQKTPIFMAHGTQDTVVLPQRAIDSKVLLEGLGYQVEWHEYVMPHTVCNPEIGDIRGFMLRCLQAG